MSITEEAILREIAELLKELLSVLREIKDDTEAIWRGQ